jgi:4-amino-4-deoxy-L-arabinose transferase-like glycosyltransferase
MPDRQQPSPGEIVILVAGAVMLVFSFLHFAGDTSAWGKYLFPVATLLPLYGVIMALQIALTRFASVKLPDRVATFTWEQIHLVLGIMAALMAISWLITDTGDKQVGLWFEVLGGIALAVGAVMLQRERHTGAIG